MGSFTQQPAANPGFWTLRDNVIETHVLKRGRTAEYRFFVEWVNADGEHNMTLVCNCGFTTKKEAEAFVLSANKLGSIKAIEASEYDVECKVPQWTKHHATPHPEAPHSDFPWGSPMTFVEAS
jgi:hypothetical protein